MTVVQKFLSASLCYQSPSYFHNVDDHSVNFLCVFSNGEGARDVQLCQANDTIERSDFR